MLDILFLDISTGEIQYGVTDVTFIRYITPSEVGFTYAGGRNSSCPFPHTERMEIVHKTASPVRAPLREVSC